MRFKSTDISPDGVRIVIDWGKFVVGTSVFVPCVNTKQAMRDIVAASGIAHKDLVKRVCVDKGRYGVRVWRSR